MCTYRSLFLLTPISPLALHVRGAPTKEVLHETQVLHGSQAIELMSLLKNLLGTQLLMLPLNMDLAHKSLNIIML